MNILNTQQIKKIVLRDRGMRIPFSKEFECYEVRNEISSDLWYFDYDVYQNCQGNWILEIRDDRLNSDENLERFMSNVNSQGLVNQ